MRVGSARLRHVRAPEHQEARVVPVSAFRHVGLLAPGLRRGWRQIAVPVVKGHAGAADKAQIARTGGVADHRHGRDRREAEHPVGAVGLGRVGVRGGDDLGRFVPTCPHETALAAGLCIRGPQGRIVLDRGPCGHRRHRGAHLPPGTHQAAADERVLHPVRGIEIPAVGGAPRAAARLVVGKARPRARIVGLLGFPGDDPGLDVDLPRTRPGAVHPVGRADDLVVLPAVSVSVFPVAVFAGGLTPTVRELLQLLALEEVQSVEQMAHCAVLSGVWIRAAACTAREFGWVTVRAGGRF